jgi:hypothetical protein
MKIFQIGFNKCGTRSISQFFKRHGMKTTDWEHGELAKSIKADVDAGQAPLGQWTDTDVFSDMEYIHAIDIVEGYRYFKELNAAYPDALFILNTRNGEGWIKSRHAHGAGAYTDAYRRFYGYGTIDEVFMRWRREWYRHHAEVLEYFVGDRADQLFVWDIEAPQFDVLQSKVGFELETKHWAQHGKTG